MKSPNANCIVLTIEEIDYLLFDKQCEKAKELISRLTKEIDDIDLLVELGEICFNHGLLYQAEFLSNKAYKLKGIFHGNRAVYDLYWLRINIAWQLGDINVTIKLLEDFKFRYGNHHGVTSLEAAALSVKHILSHSSYAEPYARMAIQMGGERFQVQFTAGVVMMKIDPEQGRPILESLISHSDTDSQTIAYSDIASAILDNRQIRPKYRQDWTYYNNMTYMISWRDAIAILEILSKG